MTADTVVRHSPLEAYAEPLRAAGRGMVRLRELPFLAQLDLRLDPADAGSTAAAAGVLGTPPPTVAGTVAVAGDRRVLWLGPDWWLVVDAPGAEAALESGLRTALAGRSSSVVDVSANRTTVELTGPRAREVLETGCTLDLHPRAFPAGRCAQTMLARAHVVLDRVDDVAGSAAYRLLVRGSFAPYLADWLLDAASGLR